MPFLNFLPAMLQAGGRLAQGRDARLQANLLREQSRAAASQGAADEEAQRRSARMQISRQIAAVGQNGGGYGGSAGALLDQSSVFAELDALNIRYGAQARSKGLAAQSMALRGRARSAGLLAGAELLSGMSSAYTRGKMSST